ncbi:MAG: dipeptide ABC transporter ATP-binding protein [Oligoflexia bacterium]|nr:dipeptide ABC transporter ATP-binding protein [Oligoflexia bacterium]
MSLSVVENYILEVSGLKKHFPIYGGVLYRKIADVKALNSASFKLKKGETLGIVGESGCGKSTLAKTLMRLYEPDEGSIMFEGNDVLASKDKTLLYKNMQMIFQDPYSSLNPRMTVGEIISEPLVIHKVGTKTERRQRLEEILEHIGMRTGMLERYPHEFSGGQRQRIGVARALALNPRLIIADEPVSALDVSIQSQILNLLVDLQKTLGITYIFISHDLSVVEYISDTIAVMYLGYIVEKASREELFRNPLHPYTKSLFASIPVPDPRNRTRKVMLKGDVPSPINMPSGCPFHQRCPVATDDCKHAMPDLKNISGIGSEHLVACINVS